MKKLFLGLSLLFCLSNICEAVSKYKVIVSTKDTDIGYTIRGSQKYEIMADSGSTSVITLSSSTANFNVPVNISTITYNAPSLRIKTPNSKYIVFGENNWGGAGWIPEISFESTINAGSIKGGLYLRSILGASAVSLGFTDYYTTFPSPINFSISFSTVTHNQVWNFPNSSYVGETKLSYRNGDFITEVASMTSTGDFYSKNIESHYGITASTITTSLLYVEEGNINIHRTTGEPQLRLKSDAGGIAWAMRARTAGSGYLSLMNSDSGLEFLNIIPSGGVGIGKTPTYKLDVADTANFDKGIISSTGTITGSFFSVAVSTFVVTNLGAVIMIRKGTLPTSGYDAGVLWFNTIDNRLYCSTEAVTGSFSWLKQQ